MYRVKIAVLFLSSFVATLAAPHLDNSTIVGVWSAKMDSLPFIRLTMMEEEDGKLIGAVLFYLIRRDPGGPPTASPGIPEPLIAPSFDGKTLSFKVSHRHAHAGTEHDPPVTFRFELTGPNKLKALNPDGPPVEMVRDTPYRARCFAASQPFRMPPPVLFLLNPRHFLSRACLAGELFENCLLNVRAKSSTVPMQLACGMLRTIAALEELHGAGTAFLPVATSFLTVNHCTLILVDFRNFKLKLESPFYLATRCVSTPLTWL